MLVVNTLFSTNEIGGVGRLIRIAPLPIGEYVETPTLLIESTFTVTLEPHAKLNGAAFRTKLET